MSDLLIHLSCTNKNSMFHLLSGKHRFLSELPFIFQFSILSFFFRFQISSLSCPIGTRSPPLPRTHFTPPPMEAHRRTNQARRQSRLRTLPQNRPNDSKQLLNLRSRRAVEKRNQHIPSPSRRNHDNARRSILSPRPPDRRRPRRGSQSRRRGCDGHVR